MTASYAEFLARKHGTVPEFGYPCDADELTGDLFPFQRHIVAWAIRRGRRFVGIELNPRYWQVACKNLTRAEDDANAPLLFDLAEVAS